MIYEQKCAKMFLYKFCIMSVIKPNYVTAVSLAPLMPLICKDAQVCCQILNVVSNGRSRVGMSGKGLLSH